MNDDSSANTELEPLVSVGIPTYNRPEGLRRTLECITGQTYGNLEIIVSDNASLGNETGSVMREFMAHDHRIQFYQQPENRGPLLNFQFVLEKASGEYFMWASDDDAWEPTFVSQMVDLLEERSDAILSFSRFDSIDQAGSHVQEYDLLHLESRSLYERLGKYLSDDESNGKANLIMGLMRRDVLCKAGGFKIWGGPFWGADMLIVLRLLSLGNVVFAKERLFSKRLPEPSGRRTLLRVGDIVCRVNGYRNYMKTCRKIIEITDGLTLHEREKLTKVIRSRGKTLLIQQVGRVLLAPANASR